MPHTTPGRLAAALIGAGLAGMLLALQTRLNGGLSLQLDNGYLAATVSFGAGLVVLTIALCFSARARAGFRLIREEIQAKRLPVWVLATGVAGAVYVLSQGLIATVMGVALFTVGIVGGQVVGGLMFDRIGLGPGGRINPTVTRVIGTALAVIAVAVSVWPNLSSGRIVWLVLLPLGMGVIMAWQTTVNGIVRSAARSAVTSTFINFAVGTIVLLVVSAVSVAVDGWPKAWPTEFWYYVGGPIGAIFIAVVAILVRIAGVLLLSMANVAGQLVAALLLEAGVPLADGVTPVMVVGTVVALIAVIVASFPSRQGGGKDQDPDMSNVS